MALAIRLLRVMEVVGVWLGRGLRYTLGVFLTALRGVRTGGKGRGNGIFLNFPFSTIRLSWIFF